MSKEEFEQKIAELRKNSMIKLSHWWGLGPMPGGNGKIITNDGKVYTYEYYHNISNNQSEKFKNCTNNITFNCQITNAKLNKLKHFIKTNILAKEQENILVYDACKKIEINVDGKNQIIENDEKLYKEINSFIDKLINHSNLFEKMFSWTRNKNNKK